MRARSTELILASLGALLAHEMGYGAVGAAASVRDPGHAHLPALFGLVLPLAVFVGGLGVLRLARHRVGGVSARRLTMIQLGLFSVLEFAEHGSALAAITNPAVIVGLLAQPLVAWLITLVLTNTAHALAHRSSRSLPVLTPRAEAVELPALPTFACALVTQLPHRRGPPS